MSGPNVIEFDSRQAKQYHVVILDLETSGLEEQHEVLQIGALKVTEDLTKVVSAFEIKAFMDYPDRAAQAALQVNRYDAAVWADEAVHKQEASRRFAQWIAEGSDQVKFAGHNIAGFDWPRLCRMFERSGVQLLQVRWPRSYQDPEGEDAQGKFIRQPVIPGDGYHSLIDTGPLSAMLQIAVGQQELGSLSLRPVARYCGYAHDRDRGHEAVYDCETTLYVMRWMKAALLTGAVEAKRLRQVAAWEMLRE